MIEYMYNPVHYGGVLKEDGNLLFLPLSADQKKIYTIVDFDQTLKQQFRCEMH